MHGFSILRSGTGRGWPDTWCRSRHERRPGTLVPGSVGRSDLNLYDFIPGRLSRIAVGQSDLNLSRDPRDRENQILSRAPGTKLEKSPLTYQFLTFGISPRNMTYQPGIWHISVVWHISQDFDISVRILYRLPLQYKPFCTVFHCSTKPGVFASGTWESHSVPSFTPPPTKLLPFSQTTTRAVTPVAVGRRPLYARQD